MEVMIPSFNVHPQIIGIDKNEIIKIQTSIKPLHLDEEEKQNNDYWTAYILKGKKSIFVEVEIEYERKDRETTEETLLNLLEETCTKLN